MKKHSIKALSLVLVLCMLLACVACGSTSTPAGDSGSGSKETYKLVFTTHLPETGVDGASLKYFLE